MEQEKAERPPAPHKCNPFTVVWKKTCAMCQLFSVVLKHFAFGKFTFCAR